MTESERPLPTGEKGAPRRQDGAGTLAARLLLSAAAIAFFGAIGWFVTDLWSPAAGSALEFGGGDAAAPVTGNVPAPPGGEVSFRYAGSKGRHRRYETNLSGPEVVDFYTRALTERGWRVDARTERPAGREGAVQAVRAFTRGAARCIIAAEEKIGAGTAVTVLIVPLGGTQERNSADVQ